MSVTLVFPDGGLREFRLAQAEPDRVRYRRALYRPPFSNRWRTEGDGRKDPDAFRLTFYVHANSITEASPVFRGILRDVQRARFVRGWFGEFFSIGILRSTHQPIASGYRLDVLVGANPGRIDIATAHLHGVTIRTSSDDIALTTGVVMFGGEPVTFAGQPVTFGGEVAPLSAHFTWSPEEPEVDQVVTFDASTTTGGTLPRSYAWEDLGPGGPWYLGDGETLEYTFSATGEHDIRLIATDANDVQGTFIQTITVG